jgi:hypothetical protein
MSRIRTRYCNVKNNTTYLQCQVQLPGNTGTVMSRIMPPSVSSITTTGTVMSRIIPPTYSVKYNYYRYWYCNVKNNSTYSVKYNYYWFCNVKNNCTSFTVSSITTTSTVISRIIMATAIFQIMTTQK